MSKESPSKLYGSFVKIGRGAFSNVWTAIDKVTGDKVAIKVIKIEKKTFKYVRGEVVTMKRFESHPNVVRYIGSFVLPKVEQIWIVMEFLEGGCLMDYVGVEQEWPEDQISFVLRDSLKALAYLHSKERIHRDIVSPCCPFALSLLSLAHSLMAEIWKHLDHWRRPDQSWRFWLCHQRFRVLGLFLALAYSFLTLLPL